MLMYKSTYLQNEEYSLEQAVKVGQLSDATVTHQQAFKTLQRDELIHSPVNSIQRHCQYRVYAVIVVNKYALPGIVLVTIVVRMGITHMFVKILVERSLRTSEVILNLEAVQLQATSFSHHILMNARKACVTETCYRNQQFDNSAKHYGFSSEKVDQLRDETANDPILALLRDLIVSGWPALYKEVPKVLRPYRDELSVENRVILKGREQVLIPKSMQHYILTSLHAGHQGRAKTSVYWNNISRDIEDFVANCPICQRHMNSQQNEPLMQKDIPLHPWHSISADFFTFDGKEYILVNVADSYTKYPFIHFLSRSWASEVTIDCFKTIFSTQGIPEVLYTDNGPQFSSHVFKSFAKDWLFQHITSSPRYPQSNGFIERMVQTVKNTLRKAKLDNVDPNLAMLCLRITPVNDKVKSPMELLMGRKAKSNLPIVLRNEHDDRDSVNDAMREQQDRQKFYYNNRSVKELPTLCSSQRVRVQDHIVQVKAQAVVVMVEYFICQKDSWMRQNSYYTSFMYIIACLCMLKIYQNRHPDISARAHSSFLLMAFVIFIAVIGVVYRLVDMLCIVLLSIQIYYNGRWKLDIHIFKKMWWFIKSNIMHCARPIYMDRLILLYVGIIINWALAIFGAVKQPADFASFLLTIFISNLLLYSFFYIVMKIRSKEKIPHLTKMCIVFSMVTWGSALFFFFSHLTSWQLSAAQSRVGNKNCLMLDFFDAHDIWHFLSAISLFFSFLILLTLDDDLYYTRRDKIPVF
ncbi:hypothetical protein ScPMuIL_003048 [Solemya velum]